MCVGMEEEVGEGGEKGGRKEHAHVSICTSYCS